MNISSSKLPAPMVSTIKAQQTKNPVDSKTPEESKDTTKKDTVSSAFSIERDIAYTVGSTLGLASNFLIQSVGPSYGVPQGITTGLGALMAAAGAKEMMESNSLRGRINGGIHLAVGAMTAAAPWSGNLAVGLYVTSMTALGIKAFADRPGGVIYTAGKETLSMAKEVFSKWELNSVSQQKTPENP